MVTAFEHHEADGDGKARSYLTSITKFDFIITLVTIEHVLQSVLPLSTFLQAKQRDLVEAAKEATSVISVLQWGRDNQEAWDTLYDSAVDLAAKFDVDASKPRNAGRQRHRENVPADTPSQLEARNVSAIRGSPAAGTKRPALSGPGSLRGTVRNPVPAWRSDPREERATVQGVRR